MSGASNRVAHAILWAVFVVNLITMVFVFAIGVIMYARLDSMAPVYNRCSVGIRWVERYADQGKIIVVERKAFKELKGVIEHEIPYIGEPGKLRPVEQ